MCIAPINDEMSFLLGNYWFLWCIQLSHSLELTVKIDVSIFRLHLPRSERVQRQFGEKLWHTTPELDKSHSLSVQIIT